jgi:hypothetical protein
MGGNFYIRPRTWKGGDNLIGTVGISLQLYCRVGLVVFRISRVDRGSRADLRAVPQSTRYNVSALGKAHKFVACCEEVRR